MKRAVLLVVMAVVAWGCATQPSYLREGVKYGVTEGVFRGRWWSYYERGTSFLEGGFNQEAEADFQKALVGRSRDSWQARTYGLHFAEYFPNRELGVAYYGIGRLDDAEKQLDISLGQIDTARAHYYLDLVKRAKIAQGALTDAVDPSLTVSLQNGAILSAWRIPVEVDASDDLGVAMVRVNGRTLHQRGSATQLAFEDKLVLDEGSHTIRIDALDLADKAAAQTIELKVDLTGPAIGVFEPAPRLVTDAARVRLRGAAKDENGVVSVDLGDTPLAKSDGAKLLEFETDAALSDGRNTFVLSAKDAAGNVTYTAVSVFKGTQDQLAAFLTDLPARLLAPLRFAHVRFAEPPRFFPRLAGNVAFAQDVVETGSEDVRITMKFPKEDLGDYRREDIRVTGQVEAKTNVESLTVGDKTIDLVSAPAVEFSRVIPLSRGKNLIAVRAEDDSGHRTEESVAVESAYFALEGFRMSVAVLAFGGDVAQESRDLLRGFTEKHIIESKRFEVVDREHLQDVLTEQQLSEALGDRDYALTLGKVIPAQVYLVGQVIPHAEGGLEVFADVVGTETSAKITKIDTYIEKKDDLGEVEFGASAIAEGLADFFPRVPGQVLGVSGADVVADIGTKRGVKRDTYVVFVFEQPPLKDNDTGEILAEGILEGVGRGRISTVQEDRSVVKVDESELHVKDIKKGMPVITW